MRFSKSVYWMFWHLFESSVSKLVHVNMFYTVSAVKIITFSNHCNNNVKSITFSKNPLLKKSCINPSFIPLNINQEKNCGRSFKTKLLIFVFEDPKGWINTDDPKNKIQSIKTEIFLKHHRQEWYKFNICNMEKESQYVQTDCFFLNKICSVEASHTNKI